MAVKDLQIAILQGSIVEGFLGPEAQAAIRVMCAIITDTDDLDDLKDFALSTYTLSPNREYLTGARLSRLNKRITDAVLAEQGSGQEEVGDD